MQQAFRTLADNRSTIFSCLYIVLGIVSINKFDHVSVIRFSLALMAAAVCFSRMYTIWNGSDTKPSMVSLLKSSAMSILFFTGLFLVWLLNAF